MTKIEALKELYKINLDELNQALNLKLKIRFKKDGKFSVLNKNKKVLEKEISYYEPSYFGQKDFILKVASRLFKFVRDDFDMPYDEIEVDCLDKTCKIVGNKDYMYEKFRVDIIIDNIKICKEGEFSYNCLRKIFKKLKSNLDGNKVEVFYDNNLFGYDVFYINFVIYETVVGINYLDNKEYSDLKTNLKKDKIYLYYSNVDKEEAIKAVKYVEELLYG